MMDTPHTHGPHPPLIGVFLALIALLAGTVALATVDLGALAIPAMLTIAGIKAALIVLYFMHARYSGPLTWVIAATAVVWMTILVAITLVDYWSRGWLPVPSGW